ncbi:hydroxyaromatic non-oxidative decarboxylase protein B [Klebsiella pneumoniae]|uniref:Hydroxyaromatic non-oxidative decarboxylase protein B n=1 Tax=Klebsiella pneumoniae TaxID=573 RepID=A0A2X3ENJ4_KLEPN|nr:hydroxyaromatic non-oxidative decarboxylase protein B [Klebsiella pneumoniae]
MKLIIGMTGATGAPLGVALLQALRDMPEVETHLVMSKWAKTTIELETPWTAREVAALADFSHSPADQAATISSGSFRTDGMIVIPCSMKTLAGIRAGYAEGLVGRAADVVLKEGRKLVLVPREMPLSTIHLENMLALSRMGVAMVPPMQLTTTTRRRLTISPIISSPGCWISLASTITKRAAGTACARQNNLHRRSNNGF